MDLDKIRLAQREGCKVFGINSYVSSDLAKTIPPDCIVLSDPVYLGQPDNPLHEKYYPEFKKDLEVLKTAGSSVFVPHYWHAFVGQNPLFDPAKTFYFYHVDNFFGGLTGCDILQPLYYAAMTAYMGILIAAYMGFSEIYLVGFDEDHVTQIGMNEENQLLIRDRHFYAEAESIVNKNYSTLLGQGYEEFCIGRLTLTHSHKMIFADTTRLGIRVVNCNPESFVTCFPKTSEYVAKSR